MLRPVPPLSGLCAVLALCATPAWAQDDAAPRQGAERDVVVQLAYTLGEAHALHRLCAGPSDATWYGRMRRLEEQEGANPASRRQLVESFNAGFAARQTEFQGCTRRSREAERGVADRGRALAARLAGAQAAQP
jgi:uncharacterized protein (TIGR02301 family)